MINYDANEIRVLVPHAHKITEIIANRELAIVCLNILLLKLHFWHLYFNFLYVITEYASNTENRN